MCPSGYETRTSQSTAINLLATVNSYSSRLKSKYESIDGIAKDEGYITGRLLGRVVGP